MPEVAGVGGLGCPVQGRYWRFTHSTANGGCRGSFAALPRPNPWRCRHHRPQEPEYKCLLEITYLSGGSGAIGLGESLIQWNT